MSVERNIALFGTEQPPQENKRLEVGPWRLSFEAGGLRHVCYAGSEVVRGIHYLLRDGIWSTPGMSLRPPSIESDDEFCSIEFEGALAEGDIRFDLQCRIEVRADGGLSFHASGIAGSDFKANRIGFTVLHPTPGCEGVALEVEHLDGSVEQTCFPRVISPSQPVFDIRALRYAIDDTVAVDCRLGSTRPGGRREPFEMEDHRNWSDASFKTYVGTLLEPLPYKVRKGDRFEQKVELHCRPLRSPAPDHAPGNGSYTLTLGPASGRQLPPLGLAVPHGSIQEALERETDIARLGPHHLTAYVRPDDQDLTQDLKTLVQLAAGAGAKIELEVEMPCEASPESELERIALACKEADLHLTAVLACPSAYLRSYQPSAEWPQVPPLEEIYDAARRLFPGARIGGGMLTYFTELNRKWPPAGAIDFVSHTVTPIVHAADDQTVVENLGTLEAMSITAHERLGAIEHRLGPSAISMRHNPYGAGTLANLANVRLAMADQDPRERGLFAAAWTLGLIAKAGSLGLGAATLFATAGPRSVLQRRGDRPQPWYDDVDGACVRPVYHLLKALTAQSGAALRHATLSPPNGATACLALDGPDGTQIWLANMSDTPTSIHLQQESAVSILDSTRFEAACTHPGWSFSDVEQTLRTVELDAYAVARCRMEN